MSKLLDERPIVIQPSIVKALGFERAVILQQIHYHLESPKSGKTIEGEKWIWNTYEEWAEEFTFWEPRTIRKWMAKLEDDGLIITAQFDKADWNRRKYYRIDYDVFHSKTGASKRHDDDASEIPEDDTSMRHDDDTSRGQHDDASFIGTKTSTKTSTKTAAAEPFNADPEPDTKNSTAFISAIDQIAAYLCHLYGIPETAGHTIKGQYQSLAMHLEGAGATIEQLKAFWEFRYKKPQVRYFCGDFTDWRVNENAKKGSNAKSNGSNIDHKAIVSRFKATRTLGVE